MSRAECLGSEAGAEVAIVPMRWWHLESVAALEQRIFGPTAWTLEQFYAELAADRWLRAAIQREPASEETVVGYVDVACSGRDSDLMTIAVAPEQRGRGLGGRLLDLGLRAAASAGADRMLLEVRSDNPAEGLYRRRGFERLDVRRDYYGRGVDALVMRRRLAAAQAVAEGTAHRDC